MIQRHFQRSVEALAKIRKVMAEVDYYEEKARAKSKQASLASHKLYKSVSNSDDKPLRMLRFRCSN